MRELLEKLEGKNALRSISMPESLIGWSKFDITPKGKAGPVSISMPLKHELTFDLPGVPPDEAERYISSLLKEKSAAIKKIIQGNLNDATYEWHKKAFGEKYDDLDFTGSKATVKQYAVDRIWPNHRGHPHAVSMYTRVIIKGAKAKPMSQTPLSDMSEKELWRLIWDEDAEGILADGENTPAQQRRIMKDRARHYRKLPSARQIEIYDNWKSGRY